MNGFLCLDPKNYREKGFILPITLVIVILCCGFILHEMKLYQTEKMYITQQENLFTLHRLNDAAAKHIENQWSSKDKNHLHSFENPKGKVSYQRLSMHQKLKKTLHDYMDSEEQENHDKDVDGDRSEKDKENHEKDGGDQQSETNHQQNNDEEAQNNSAAENLHDKNHKNHRQQDAIQQNKNSRENQRFIYLKLTATLKNADNSRQVIKIVYDKKEKEIIRWIE